MEFELPRIKDVWSKINYFTKLLLQGITFQSYSLWIKLSVPDAIWYNRIIKRCRTPWRPRIGSFNIRHILNLFTHITTIGC